MKCASERPNGATLAVKTGTEPPSPFTTSRLHHKFPPKAIHEATCSSPSVCFIPIPLALNGQHNTDKLHARVTPHISARHHDQPKAVIHVAWNTQTRLCADYQALIRHRKTIVVVVVMALGRELVGFLWAIARELATPGTAAAEALKGETPGALRKKNTEALEKAATVTVKSATKAGRRYVLGTRKKYEPAKLVAARPLKAGARNTDGKKALRKEKKNRAAR